MERSIYEKYKNYSYINKLNNIKNNFIFRYINHNS